MLQICPDAEVISIEDSQTYFDEYKGLGSGTAKVHIYHVPIKDGYSSYPLVFGGIFDLIFVDGKDDQRPECLQTAYNMLSADGVCILHDSERENYVEAIKSFKVLEDVNGTVVLTK
jgi:precorrin-6B methylase 2